MKLLRILPFLLVFLLIGATCERRVETTGDLLIKVSDRFVSTHSLVRAARAAEALTDDEWRTWVSFVNRYQKRYDQAYNLWLSGLDGPGTRAELRALLDEIAFHAIKRVK